MCVTRTGWDLVTDPPVLFLRNNSMCPLPVPIQGGNYKDILKFLNLGCEEDKLLVLTWPLVATITTCSRPILLLYGASGACKSSALAALRGLLDPSEQMLTYVQKKVDDLILYLSQHAIPSFDNITKMSKDIENILCMAVTEGGTVKRKIYTDSDCVSHSVQRPILVTSLEIPTNAQDLLDRTIAVELCRVAPGNRRLQSVLKREYEEALPGIIGGMCDALVKMLSLYDENAQVNFPRLADYASWGAPAGRALGYSEEDFAKAYKHATMRVRNDASANDDFTDVIVDFLEEKGGVEGFVAAVHLELKQHMQALKLPLNILPPTPNAFSRRLKQIILPLEASGWRCEFSASAKNGRLVKFSRIETEGATSELPVSETPLGAVAPVDESVPPVSAEGESRLDGATSAEWSSILP